MRKILATNRVERQSLILAEDRLELARPIMDRVKDALQELSSESLFIRLKAANVLRKFVGLSELCAQYVFDNGGLECILDSLDGCNRGVGSTEVVIPLCSIMCSMIKFKTIKHKLGEERRKDMVQRCFHFMAAFYRISEVFMDLSTIVLALEENCKPT
ncbi:unnamed protein product [Gongylonema pulchrum]|uniref:DCB domain-containing protein n=1 Tax=Gongylonema pulchrum TaxID=637853 RepID=A0A183ELZ5_9BILA|nr:unnamed protein product [Gongylonema pulchrum]